MKNRAARLKFGTDIEDGALMRMDHKTTHNWAWPGSRDPISKFLDLLITFVQRIEISSSNLVQTYRTDPLVRMDHKTTPNWAWPGSSDPISKTLITFERIELSA